jgi:hypothetical protein
MKKITGILVLLLVAVLSITKLSDWASDPANHAHSIAQTEDNIATVMKLSAGAAASSVAVTLLPGDIATPVANQLAELSKYFLLILSALYLEKYLITLTGYITFTWLVPIICALFKAQRKDRTLCGGNLSGYPDEHPNIRRGLCDAGDGRGEHDR